MSGRQAAHPVCVVGAFTDVGLVRSTNEDAHAVFCPGPEGRRDDHLFIVADGMGGHAYGERASNMAATIIAETYYAQAGDDVEAALIQAFTSANSAILDFSREKNAKIGTTCTVLSVRDGRATVGHVGDSRAYIVDAEGIRQLTIDHSLAASLHRDGIITIEQARTHPGRSALTRALGVREDCEPDVVIVGDVHPEDVFVLCTDGLARIPDREIEQTVRSTGPQAATEMLVAEANNRGGADNATAVVVGFREAVDR